MQSSPTTDLSRFPRCASSVATQTKRNSLTWAGGSIWPAGAWCSCPSMTRSAACRAAVTGETRRWSKEGRKRRGEKKAAGPAGFLTPLDNCCLICPVSPARSDTNLVRSEWGGGGGRHSSSPIACTTMPERSTQVESHHAMSPKPSARSRIGQPVSPNGTPSSKYETWQPFSI